MIVGDFIIHTILGIMAISIVYPPFPLSHSVPKNHYQGYIDATCLTYALRNITVLIIGISIAKLVGLYFCCMSLFHSPNLLSFDMFMMTGIKTWISKGGETYEC